MLMTHFNTDYALALVPRVQTALLNSDLSCTIVCFDGHTSSLFVL